MTMESPFKNDNQPRPSSLASYHQVVGRHQVDRGVNYNQWKWRMALKNIAYVIVAQNLSTAVNIPSFARGWRWHTFTAPYVHICVMLVQIWMDTFLECASVRARMRVRVGCQCQRWALTHTGYDNWLADGPPTFVTAAAEDIVRLSAGVYAEGWCCVRMIWPILLLCWVTNKQV